MKFTMTKIAAAAALCFAATGAQAASVSTGGAFVMYSQDGYDLLNALNPADIINTDATITGFVDNAAGTWGVASTTKFNGLKWTASGGFLVKTAGSYSLDTATGIVGAGTGVNDPVSSPSGDGIMNFNVGAGQMAGVINFAWGTTTGIRVVDVWNINSNGSLTTVFAPGMENGPFPGFNAAFNLTAPGLVPEASTYGMMLAGLGMVGFAVRRRKLMA